jgi:4-hydroxy-3-methylbut-2-enyl diphosphate reductase
MIVVGGYNSSNTQALAGICAPKLPTYHIDGAHCLDAEEIRHRPAGSARETATPGWLPSASVTSGLTAGASTPDSVVGLVVERLLALLGPGVSDLGLACTASTIPGCV